jgi:hypothetical protein
VIVLRLLCCPSDLFVRRTIRRSFTTAPLGYRDRIPATERDYVVARLHSAMRHVPALDGRRKTGLRSFHSELRAVNLLRNPAFLYIRI